MLILFFKRFSGTVSSSLTFVWKVWEQGGGSFSPSLSLILFTQPCAVPSIQLVLSGPFLKVFYSFHLVLFVVFISPHPLGCISVPPFLAPHGMLSLGVEEGGALKTLTDYNTLRDTQQCGPVNASIFSAALLLWTLMFGPAKIKVGDTPR